MNKIFKTVIIGSILGLVLRAGFDLVRTVKAMKLDIEDELSAYKDIREEALKKATEEVINDREGKEKISYDIIIATCDNKIVELEKYMNSRVMEELKTKKQQLNQECLLENLKIEELKIERQQMKQRKKIKQNRHVKVKNDISGSTITDIKGAKRKNVV